LLRELILRTIHIGKLDRRHRLETAIAALMVSELQVSGARSLGLNQPTGKATCRAATLMTNRDPRAETVASLARAVGAGTRTFERQFFAETGNDARPMATAPLKALGSGPPSYINVVRENTGQAT